MSICDIVNGFHDAWNRRDIDETIETLRQLRLHIGTGGAEAQNKLISNCDFVSFLFSVIDQFYDDHCGKEKVTIAFRIGIQCIVNLLSDNEQTRKVLGRDYLHLLRKWFATSDAKSKNYLAAAFVSLDKVNCLDDLIEDAEFVRLSIVCANVDSEFGIFLLQNLIEKGHFRKLYEKLNDSDHKCCLLHLLHSACSDIQKNHVSDVQFVSSQFKILSDSILKTIADPVERLDTNGVAGLLDLLSEVSYKEPYQVVLQADKSLIINCVFLLRALHSCLQPGSDPFKTLEETIKVLNSAPNDSSSHPTFRFKVGLIKIIANLSWRNKIVQDLVNELECIPLLLENCRIDPNNPFVMQWAILAVRNLCEGNLEVQKVIIDMENKGLADRKLLHELNVSLDGLNITPLVKDSQL